jgi:hypothetical protein
LRHKHLTGRDLDTEVTTSDHHTVSLSQNLVKVLHTLLVFNLDDNLDGRAFGAEDLADLDDILGRADERCENHVDAILDTERQVVLVLFRQGGQVDGRLGQVDTLARREGARVERLDAQVGAFDGDDLEREDTVVDVDELARGGNLGKVGLNISRRSLRERKVLRDKIPVKNGWRYLRSPCRSALQCQTRRTPCRW